MPTRPGRLPYRSRAFAERMPGVPLLANMTEFGKSELLDAATLRSIGINMVIYPVTLMRLAMGAVARALGPIAAEGGQQSLVGQMQTRAELYEVIGYHEYDEFDKRVAQINERREGPQP